MEMQLGAVAEALRSASDPFTRGRSILLDQYRRTGGALDRRVSVTARYEYMKSLVVQTAYELLGGYGGVWLKAGQLEEEMRDAESMSALYREQCYSQYAIGENAGRMGALIAHPSAGPERFLGSSRRFLPGVGYAVSVRKRDSMNQDSFLLEDSPAILGVADGCSGSLFSAVASMEAVASLAASRHSVASDPIRAICELSGRIAEMLNERSLSWAGSGFSTLTLALPAPGRTRFYKVGDSLPFYGFGSPGSMAVECVSCEGGLANILGTELERAMVERHERGVGTAVLTSDGVTNYLQDCGCVIRRALDATGDAVIAAETVLRAVLRNQMALDQADDTTIVMQDSEQGG